MPTTYYVIDHRAAVTARGSAVCPIAEALPSATAATAMAAADVAVPGACRGARRSTKAVAAMANPSASGPIVAHSVPVAAVEGVRTAGACEGTVEAIRGGQWTPRARVHCVVAFNRTVGATQRRRAEASAVEARTVSTAREVIVAQRAGREALITAVRGVARGAVCATEEAKVGIGEAGARACCEAACAVTRTGSIDTWATDAR